MVGVPSSRAVHDFVVCGADQSAFSGRDDRFTRAAQQGEVVAFQKGRRLFGLGSSYTSSLSSGIAPITRLT